MYESLNLYAQEVESLQMQIDRASA
jgi:hypothetical protein